MSPLLSDIAPKNTQSPYDKKTNYPIDSPCTRRYFLFLWAGGDTENVQVGG